MGLATPNGLRPRERQSAPTPSVTLLAEASSPHRPPQDAVGISTRRASSMTEPSSASISVARPCSMSCSIEVFLCAPMLWRRRRAFDADGNGCRRPRRPLAPPASSPSQVRVSGEAAEIFQVAWVSALIGLSNAIAPELHPDFGTHVGEHGRFEACSREELVHRRRAAFARRFRRPASDGLRYDVCTPGFSISAGWS